MRPDFCAQGAFRRPVHRPVGVKTIMLSPSAPPTAKAEYSSMIGPSSF
jgi:hypothetical protein